LGYRIKRKEGVAAAVRRIVREQLVGAISVARERSIAQDERVHEVRTRLKALPCRAGADPRGGRGTGGARRSPLAGRGPDALAARQDLPQSAPRPGVWLTARKRQHRWHLWPLRVVSFSGRASSKGRS
jgi:hypothetical protein